jgi:hypothetical protein
LTSFNFYIPTPILKLEVTIIVIHIELLAK